MKKMFVVSYDIYPFDILVCLGSSREEVLKKLKSSGEKLSESEIELINMYGLGRTGMLKSGRTVLWLNDYPKKGSDVLAHEIFHAVYFLFRRIGVELTDSSEEAYAYAIQHITNKINKEI